MEEEEERRKCEWPVQTSLTQWYELFFRVVTRVLLVRANYLCPNKKSSKSVILSLCISLPLVWGLDVRLQPHACSWPPTLGSSSADWPPILQTPSFSLFAPTALHHATAPWPDMYDTGRDGMQKMGMKNKSSSIKGIKKKQYKRTKCVLYIRWSGIKDP